MGRGLPHPSELPELSQEARNRALQALSLMRNKGHSLTHACGEAGTATETALKYAGTAIVRQENGRYDAKAWDRIVRPMKFLTPKGIIALDVKDSRSASRIARYMADVDKYLKTGDADVLRKYRGKSVTVDRVARPFITDPPELETLAAVGEVQFENMYTIKR